jgi:hypothetical protein
VLSNRVIQEGGATRSSVGDLSVQGNIKGLRSLAERLQPAIGPVSMIGWRRFGQAQLNAGNQALARLRPAVAAHPNRGPAAPGSREVIDRLGRLGSRRLADGDAEFDHIDFSGVGCS